MTRAIVMNAILDLIVVLAIVGGLAWAIWSSRLPAEPNRPASRVRGRRQRALPQQLRPASRSRRLTSSDVGT
jgi:hypothetical protein